MKRSTVVSTTLAIVVSLMMVLSVQARGMGDGHGGGFGGNGFGLRSLMQLDLSTDQKQAIHAVILKYEDEQEKCRETFSQSREEFADLISADGFDEAKIRQAFQEKASAMEDAFVLRARIHSEIQALLTAEQLEELEQMKTEHRGRGKGKHDKNSKRAKLKNWLDTDGD